MATNEYNKSSIRTMEDLEHIRSRTAVYVRSPSTNQCNTQLLKEGLDNSIDEAIDPSRQYYIGIHIFHKGDRYQVLIQDYGRGIPVESLEPCFCKLNTSGKFETGSYVASVGTNGMGGKAFCALSDRFVAISKRNDGFGYLEVQQGVRRKLELRKAIDRDKSTVGTLVFHEPDSSILLKTPEFMTDPEGLPAFLNLCDFLSTFTANADIVVTLTEKLIPEAFFKQDPAEIWRYFRSYSGDTVLFRSNHLQTPMEYARKVMKLDNGTLFDFPVIERAVDRQNDSDRFGCWIQIYIPQHLKQIARPSVLAAVNKTIINDRDSFHITGLITTIKEFIVDQIDNRDVKEFFSDQYRFPIAGPVMTWWKGAVFVGQTKDAFKDSAFMRVYTTFLRKMFKQYQESFWEALFEVLKDDIYEQYNKAMNSSLKVGKNLKNIGFQLHNFESFVNCKSKDASLIELLITEGDSAGGYVKQVRNPDNQAVYMLGGKPINAFDTNVKKLHKNAGYQDLVTLIGVSPADKTLANMNFNRIGILTDADYDGYHITALLVGNFYKINPLLLSEGRVFVANPPLYSVACGSKTLFMRDQRALEDSKIERLYRPALSFIIEDIRKKKLHRLDGQAFRDWCYLVRRVGDMISQVANTLVIEPLYVEMLAHCVDAIDPRLGVDTKTIQKTLPHIDRVEYRKEYNCLILSQKNIEVTIQLTRLADEIRAYVLKDLQDIGWENFNCYVTTLFSDTLKNVPMSFVQLYDLLNSLDKRFTIHRNKGLGEMEVEELYYTCVDPTTRSYTTITSIGDLDQMYKMLGSDPTERKRLVEIAVAAAQARN